MSYCKNLANFEDSTLIFEEIEDSIMCMEPLTYIQKFCSLCVMADYYNTKWNEC